VQQIGRFQITRELGRGGMGIVYEAKDPLLGRTVAVKTIRVDTAAETAFLLDRLFREARAAGALKHPGIVIIFDVGRDGDLAYIAMERVDGPTLEELLESQPMPPHAVTLDILRQTADALDHAHESRIVHRDIKPANIMLDKGKTVKVTDFGIAKIQDTQYKSSQIMGTAKYMSPEHITGKPVDGRSDQFALGVMAFKMLTGEMPFPGDDAVGYQIVHEERPLATRSNPKLRAGVDQVLQRVLAKDPKDRYPTCAEFVAALSTALTGTQPEPIPIPTPAPAPEPGPPPPPPAAPRRSKAPLWYAAGAVAAVMLG
jgi:serine/threonine protein kinase